MRCVEVIRARVPLLNCEPDCRVQVLFQFLPGSETDSTMELGGIRASPSTIPLGLEHAKLDLCVNIGGDGRMSFDYMAELFDAATIERLASNYLALLEAAGARPDLSLESLSILGRADSELLARFCAGELRPAYLNSPLVHNAFASWALREPERPCLIFEGRVLAYGEVGSTH